MAVQGALKETWRKELSRLPLQSATIVRVPYLGTTQLEPVSNSRSIIQVRSVPRTSTLTVGASSVHRCSDRREHSAFCASASPASLVILRYPWHAVGGVELHIQRMMTPSACDAKSSSMDSCNFMPWYCVLPDRSGVVTAHTS